MGRTRGLARATTRLVVALGVLLGALLVGPAAPAWACSCAGDLEDEEYASHADVVFVGTIVTKDIPANWTSSNTPVTYTVAVESVLKGEAMVEQEVVSPVGEASCGLESVSGRVLWFAGDPQDDVLVEADDDQLTTHLCSGTRELPTGEPLPDALAAMPAMQPLPVPPEQEGPPLREGIAVGALAAGGVALLALRRRRRSTD